MVVTSGESFKIYNYCRESDSVGKKGLKKWFKFADNYVNYNYIKYNEFDNYSDGELTKLMDYDTITDNIIKDILENIDDSKHTKIGIEGYNFGAQVGDLVDLVTFSTLLRNKLFKKISKDIIVLSPSTLKLESCKLTYNPIIKEISGKNPRKEYKWMNNFGIPGGKFQKKDMYYAIIENDNLNDYWAKHCRIMKSDMESVRSINKPYEDVNDAYLIFNVIKQKIHF